MKRIFLIISLVIVTASISSFSKIVIEQSNVIDKNCALQIQAINTVPTKRESRNIVKVPFTGNSFVGFKDALGFKESRNRYYIVNTLGYLGKYQFGKSTLRRLKIYNTLKFLKNSKQQEYAFQALCSLNKHILRREIKKNVGKRINGVRITESGILAAAHLGGAGSVRKFLRSRGVINYKDAYGTSIQNYMKKFSGFDVSAIKANRNPAI